MNIVVLQKFQNGKKLFFIIDEIEVYTPKKGDKIDLLNVKSKAFLPATVT